MTKDAGEKVKTNSKWSTLEREKTEVLCKKNTEKKAKFAYDTSYQ